VVAIVPLSLGLDMSVVARGHIRRVLGRTV